MLILERVCIYIYIISRYFRQIFEGEISDLLNSLELYFNIKFSKNSYLRNIKFPIQENLI